MQTKTFQTQEQAMMADMHTSVYYAVVCAYRHDSDTSEQEGLIV